MMNYLEEYDETDPISIETYGLQIEKKNGKNYNNFPKASENPVCHVRPHGKDAKDTDEKMKRLENY